MIVAYSYFYIQLSSIVGWIYFVAWTISFWPQMINNFRRKSVVGLSFDFTALNFVGHTLYMLFNVSLYYSTFIEVNIHRNHRQSIILPRVTCRLTKFSLQRRFKKTLQKNGIPKAFFFACHIWVFTHCDAVMHRGNFSC